MAARSILPCSSDLLAGKSRLLEGLLFGLTFVLLFLVFAIAMLIGALFVSQGRLGVDELLVGLFCCTVRRHGLGQGAPLLADFAKGRGAAAAVVDVIKWEPQVNPNPTGIQMGPFVHSSDFRHVTFRFPTSTMNDNSKLVALGGERCLATLVPLGAMLLRIV